MHHRLFEAHTRKKIARTAYFNQTFSYFSLKLQKLPLFKHRRLLVTSASLLLLSSQILLSQSAYAFLYPFDFGSFVGQPRTIVNNAALIYACDQSPSFASRLRTNHFQPKGLSRERSPSEPTDGNAIEAEVGLCKHITDWASVGLFSAISAYDLNLTTQSLDHPIVFPFQKTYLPVISAAIAVEPIENLHLGFAAQFFETLKIDVNLYVLENLRGTINTRIGAAANWNIGVAYETPAGVFHLGYQPAFEADLDLSITTPLELTEISPIFPVDVMVDIIVLDGGLDYRPANWQIGWIGKFYNGVQAEFGVLLNQWEELGAEYFIRLQDPVGALDFFLLDRAIELKNTINPYVTLSFPVNEHIKLHGGLARFESPLDVQPNRQAAVSGVLNTVKSGFVLKTQAFNFPFFLEGNLIYGNMAEQETSGAGTVSGEFIAVMSQISFPL